MPRIVITHAVQDVGRWQDGKAERAAALPGAANVTDLVAMDGSNHAAVVFDFDDLDALKAVLSSVPPEMAAQAESHGVIMPMSRLRRGVGRVPGESAAPGRQRLQQPDAATTAAGPGNSVGTEHAGRCRDLPDMVVERQLLRARAGSVPVRLSHPQAGVARRMARSKEDGICGRS